MGKRKDLFQSAGGFGMIKQYARAHVLFYTVVMSMFIGFSHKSLEIVRLAVYNKILKRLRKKYKQEILKFVKDYDMDLPRRQSRIVWFFWMQGIDKAPQIVKKCYSSLIANMPEREIRLLTVDNYKEYVKFPEHVEKKFDQGIISITHMSDLLRLELLNRYGGTWIDATVFCSGKNIPDYMMNSDLFVFQNLKPGLDGQCTCISSWFMSACTNNPIIQLTLHLLYMYWDEYNFMVDYFLIHDFFQLSIEAYPDEWNKVMPFSNSTPHVLLLRLFEKYNDDLWSEMKRQTAFHKISYKWDQAYMTKKGTYYDVIFNS